MILKKIGFGGGCHWCTEAVFEALKGVSSVAQGWIASEGKEKSYSEAVIVVFDSEIISLETLVAVHLYTHSATAVHSMRSKYRSAVYYFSDDDIILITTAISVLQLEFGEKIITVVLPFIAFKANREESLHYYFSHPEKPFCQTYINPKLKVLLQQFSTAVDGNKLAHLIEKG